MNSNPVDSFENNSEPIKSNTFSQQINYNKKEKDEEKNEFHNLRIETTLSLRKKKLNEIIFSRRKNQINIQNDEGDKNDITLDIKKIRESIPSNLEQEFDNYDEKLTIIHQFLNNDFSPLKGMQYQEESVKEFMLYKLLDLSYMDNSIIYEEKFDKELKLVFYDVIKLINETTNKKLFYGVSAIIINFLYYSTILAQELRKVSIWKKLAEMSELKIAELNDNLIIILSNYYKDIPSVGKEYILSNYSRYIKQILINYFKTFIDESHKNNFNIKMYTMGVGLIKRLISNENSKINKKNDFDVVVKMKFIFDYLTKIFLISSSLIINNLNAKEHLSIFQFISSLLECLSTIASYANEQTYQMQEFFGESFATSYCSLIKFLVLNKEKNLSLDSILIVLSDLYNFLGLLFSFREISDIYTRNKIILITEELINNNNINIMNIDLSRKIIFFLSNYADKECRCKEIFEESNICQIIKNFTLDNIYNNSICFNSFCLIDNGFKCGGISCKELIINNFSYFLIERIKILYDLIIIEEKKEGSSYMSYILEKCQLLFSFITFLRDKTSNVQLLKDILDYIKISNIQEFIENIQTLAPKNNEILKDLLKELKFINY